MEVVGEYLGMHEDKAIHGYFREHYADWFPGLPCRTNFVRQCANLLGVKQWLLSELFAEPRHDLLHMQDGVPIPVMKRARARRDRCFKGEAGYGYCASKDEKYYGFLGHVTIDSTGRLSGFTLTPANGSERDVLLANSAGLTGIMLADKGFIGPLKEELAEAWGIELQTPLRDNMNDPRNPEFVKWVVSTRRLVETVIGQMTERFKLNAIRVKDYWHLQSRIARKLLAHSIAALIAIANNLNTTQFDKIIDL